MEHHQSNNARFVRQVVDFEANCLNYSCHGNLDKRNEDEYNFGDCLRLINEIGELNEIEYSVNLKFERPFLVSSSSSSSSSSTTNDDNGMEQRIRAYYNIGNYNVTTTTADNSLIFYKSIPIPESTLHTKVNIIIRTHTHTHNDIQLLFSLYCVVIR